MSDLNLLWGWATVLVAVVCFGSFGVPIKSKSVQEAKVDPIIFQSYKTFWAFVTSFIALTYNPFKYTPWGLISGISWVPAGIAAVIAVNCIGLGVAQGIWSGLIIVVSFAWGAFVFQEPLVSLPLSILGVILLVIGITGMAISRLSFWPKILFCCATDSELLEAVTEEVTSLIPDKDENNHSINEEEDIVANVLPCCGCMNRRTIGYLCAIFNGVWGGSVMVPLKFASRDVPAGIEYVFSFSVGAATVNLVILIIYFMMRVCVLKKEIPPFHVSVMAVPGTISGVLWSIGNYMSTYSVIFLGQAIGYPSVQAALIVSGLWAVFYYKELKRTQVIVWFISAFITLSGVGLLSQMKVSNASS